MVTTTIFLMITEEELNRFAVVDTEDL